MPIQYVADRTDNSDEPSFLSENESAMNKMMTDMTVKPTGDVDRDFVAMMVPHHQGAIDMAQAELKYGHNELLRRLAQEIIANQQQEITVMRLAVDDERPLPAGSPPQPAPAPVQRGCRMKRQGCPMMPGLTIETTDDSRMNQAFCCANFVRDDRLYSGTGH